jgi:hypothetical protein
MFPWNDNTSGDIASQTNPRYETPMGAQQKANTARDAAIEVAALALAFHKSRGNDEHPLATIADAGFMSAADKYKADTSTLFAQENQNAFSGVNDISATTKTDNVYFVGGVGITVTTDPATKKVTITATGTSTPGPHAFSHLTGGSDPIPVATAGSDGLMSKDSVTSLSSARSRLDNMFQIAPSVMTIPLKNDYRGWQGVAVSDDLIYVLTDRNESFGLENIISVYSLDGVFQSEIRAVYTATDPQGKFMSFGDGNVIDGALYVTAYNVNSGGTPLVSRVLKYTLPGLTLSETYAIGSGTAESVTKYNNAYWVVYYDILAVRKYDLNFNFVQEYPLPAIEAPHGYFQGSFWEDGYFYANLHGHNVNESSSPFAKLVRYSFDGTSFTFDQAITPPTLGCSQGVSIYEGFYVWNDRPNNVVVITKNKSVATIYPTTLPLRKQNTFKPELLNGWTNFDTTYDRTARITVQNGIVYFSGIIQNPSNPDAYNGATRIFKIPTLYAPKFNTNFLALTDKGPMRMPVVGKNTVQPAEQIGNVNVQNILAYSNITWLSLDGISYPILE